ncbi:MAG: cyclic-di-AMP receptor [Anaerolineae bacterium]|nr:cyclic-di-AMP receptor [Anaerolineae bacterium]
MKLLIVILRDGDAGTVMERLIAGGYRVTRIASAGGFLRRGNVTLLIGAETEEVDRVIDLLRQTCAPPEPGQHRATVFVVEAAHFEQV